MTGILPKTANRVCRQISDSPATSCFEEQRLPERTGYHQMPLEHSASISGLRLIVIVMVSGL